MNLIFSFLQEYGGFFAVLGGIVAVLGLAFTLYKASHSRHLRFLEDRIAQLESENDNLKKRSPDEKLILVNEELQRQLDEQRRSAEERQAKSTSTIDDLKAQIIRKDETTGELTKQLEGLTEKLDLREQQNTQRTNLLKRAMKLEGRVWIRKVLQGAPKFRPLSKERHVAVVSILNLKGGVGKTTLTAHLGAALSAKGYRVLLVDLDLQGSLSSLFVNESALSQRNADGLLLRHYLTAVAENRKANLLDYTVPILDGQSAIVPTADSMAYAELNLTMNWLLRLGKKDTRFLLRRALHQRHITSRFDIVLMDCPPIFNTCCVNALAASDYVLIPATPSVKVAERIPLLLERLKGLCAVINPELQVAGIVLNRTHGAQLTSWERDLWNDILERSLDRWKLPIHGFQTSIRHTTEVRDSEHDFCSPAPGSELFGAFSRLAAEFEERIPRDCRRSASISVGSE